MTAADGVGPGPDQSDVEGRSVGDLVGELTSDLSRLMRQELELARTEIRAEAVKAGRAGGMLGGAGALAHLTLMFLALALMWALGNVIDLGWAALVVGALLAVGAAALFAVGRRRLRAVNPTPERTVETVKEDVRWARTRNS
jgi:uncharacterized membrane protein YqjE